MRYKYLIGLIVALAGGCLYLFQMIYYEVREKTIAELNSRQLINARQAAIGIEEYFSDLIFSLTKISESGHIISLDEQGIKEMDFALKTSRQEIKAIARADESGRILCSLPYEQTVIGKDTSHQKHIREIMKTRKPVVSDVFNTMRGYNAIGLYVPVFQGKEYRGTLAFLIDFQAISRRFLQDIRIGETGYAWMISRDGIELYCPVPGHIGKSVFENCKEFPSIIAMANEMLKGRQGVTTYTYNQIRDKKTETVRKQAVYLPLKVGNTFWSIVVASSEDEALASLINFRNKLIFVIGLLLMGSAVIAFYGMKARIIVREAAKRQKAEDALRESEARYKSLFENNHAVMLLIDPENSSIADANPAACKFYGWSREELKKQRIDEINTLTSEEIKAEIRLAQSEMRNHFFFKHRTADGTIRDVEVYSGPLTLEGKATLYSIIHDITERKRAEKALHESEERFRSMIQSLIDMIFILDRNGRLTFESPSASRILGYHPGYFIGKSPFIHIHHDDLDQVVKAMEEVVQSVNPGIPTPFRCRKSDDTWCYLEAIGSNQFENPSIQGIVLTVRDITERKRMEEEQKLLHDRFLTVMDSIDATIYVADIESHEILFMNKQMQDSFGGDFTGQKCWKVFRNEVGPCSYCTNGRLRDASGNPSGVCIWEGQNPITGKWYNNYDRAIRWVDGRIVRIQIAMDISDRKLTEDALKESEKKYRLVLEANPDPMIVYDIEGKVIYLNPAFTSVFGWSMEERIGKKMDDFVPDESWPETRMMIEMVIAGKNFYGIETTRLTREGAIIPVSISGACYRNQEGNIEASVINLRDITERRCAEEEKAKLEEQYRQAQKMEAIGQLAGGVAHDFNNMLSIILGYSQMALMKTEPSGPLYKNIEEIMNAAKRSADLVRQLLAFARKQTIAPKALDLNDTVAGMLGMLRKLIGEDIDLLWMPAANLWPVKMDPAQVDQVLANLAVNARDSIEGVGKITIETGRAEFDEAYCVQHSGSVPGHYAMLVVSDNGCGMDRETCGKIFEPFFTTKEVGKGTGMGLATVYGIVKQNNGFIDVYSEPGKGTTFRIYLPRFVGEDVKTGEQSVNALPQTGTETVLLVEDDDALLEMSKIMLKGLDYTVLTAGSPGEAIRLAGEYKGDIHLLLTDVVMPEMSGRDLQKRISIIRPGIKCLFMSGYTADVIAHRGILDKDVNYLQKPFSINNLASKVRKALEKA